MRKIILNLTLSLDGYIEGANGEYDWCFTDQDYGMTEFLSEIDILLMGRKTYELLQKEGMDYFQDKTKYVCSQTLKDISKKDILINQNTIASIKSLKLEQGKNIWLFGGAELTNSLLKENLVDEMILSIHPLLLGKGKPLFGELDRIYWKLLSSQSYSSGLVQMRYALERQKNV